MRSTEGRQSVARVIFIDTSAFYSLLDRSDTLHEVATRYLSESASKGYRVVTSNFVLAESHALVMGRLGASYARRFLQSALGSVAVERVSEIDEDRARGILLRYVDKTYTYTDSTSFALMERLGVKHAFTFDSHFVQHGFSVVPLLPCRR